MGIDVYISPSTQPHYRVPGGGSEQSIQRAIGAHLEAALRRCGISCYLSQWTGEGRYVQAAQESNRLGARYHFSLHSDGLDGPRGVTANWTHSIVFPGAREARRVAVLIEEELKAATGWPSRGVVERSDLYELSATDAHAILTESGFHTNPTQAAVMRTNPGLFAEAYCRAFCRALGRTYIPAGGKLDKQPPTPPAKTQEEPEVSAQDVWMYGVRRPGDKNADKEGRVSALQELADAKTIAMRVDARLAVMEAALKALAEAKSIDPAPIVAAIEVAGRDAVAQLAASLDGVQATVTLGGPR